MKSIYLYYKKLLAFSCITLFPALLSGQGVVITEEEAKKKNNNNRSNTYTNNNKKNINKIKN